jgi:hypothetical protein
VPTAVQADSWMWGPLVTVPLADFGELNLTVLSPLGRRPVPARMLTGFAMPGRRCGPGELDHARSVTGVSVASWPE